MFPEFSSLWHRHAVALSLAILPLVGLAPPGQAAPSAHFSPATGLLEVECIRRMPFFDDATLAPAYRFSARLSTATTLQIIPSSVQALDTPSPDCLNMLGTYPKGSFTDFPHYVFLPDLEAAGNSYPFEVELGLGRESAAGQLTILFQKRRVHTLMTPQTLTISSGETRAVNISAWLSEDFPVPQDITLSAETGSQLPGVLFAPESRELVVTGMAPGLYTARIATLQDFSHGQEQQLKIVVCAAATDPCDTGDSDYLQGSPYADYLDQVAIAQSSLAYLKATRAHLNTSPYATWCVSLGSTGVRAPLPTAALQALSDASEQFTLPDQCHGNYSIFSFNLGDGTPALAVRLFDLQRTGSDSATLQIHYGSVGYRYFLQRDGNTWQVVSTELLFIA